MSDGSLLDADLVRDLEALRRRLALRVASSAAGEHRARTRGAGSEFAEHRPYAPGDDVRRVDWLAYARTGDPVLKTYHAEREAVVRLLVDTSASMEGEKLRQAARVAAALAYLCLADGERVQVIPFADRAAPADHAARGRGALVGLLRTLASLRAEGTTRIARATDAALASGRPGWLVVVSDFLDPEGFEAAAARARTAGHELSLVQVLDPEELDPTFEGDLTLEDAEGAPDLALTADADLLDAYRARLRSLFAALSAFARSRGASYVRTRSDAPLEPCLRRVVERRVDGCD